MVQDPEEGIKLNDLGQSHVPGPVARSATRNQPQEQQFHSRVLVIVPMVSAPQTACLKDAETANLHLCSLICNYGGVS